jgi:phage terminase large subunit
LVEDGDPSWFVERLTIEDTGVLSAADIEAERREGMDEELVQQEYFCSFEGAQQGSYYGRAMNQAEAASAGCRIRRK